MEIRSAGFGVSLIGRRHRAHAACPGGVCRYVSMTKCAYIKGCPIESVSLLILLQSACAYRPTDTEERERGQASKTQLPACYKKIFLPAGSTHIDLAVSDPRNSPLPQRVVAGASPARSPGDGIAAHHGATADVNRFTDLVHLKDGFRVLVAAGVATQKDDQSGQNKQPFFHGTLENLWNGFRSNDFSADDAHQLSRSRSVSTIPEKVFSGTKRRGASF
jgi:hypothetical protein